MSRILTPQQKIERSIVADFRRDIWNKFVMGYERYDMIKPGDNVRFLYDDIYEIK